MLARRMRALTSNSLATTAIVLGAIVVGACFLPWAAPRRSAADLAGELERGLETGDRPADAPLLIGGLREAYAQAGTGKPFHGMWAALLAGLGVVVTMVAASLKDEARKHAEMTYRVAGAIFALAMLVVMLDAGSGIFGRKDRAAGLWIAMGAALAAALAATFASARAEVAGDVTDTVE